MAIDAHAVRNENQNIDWKGADFHRLSFSEVDQIVDAAKKAKYYKPKNANGSRARYFFYAVQRKLNQKG